MPRPAQWVVFAILLALTITLGGIATLAFSERGTGFLLGWLGDLEPRLSVQHERGNLFALHLGSLRWQDESADIHVTDIQWRIDGRCLFDDTLCVKQLSAASVSITVVGGSGESSPLELAPVLLPLDIELDALRVGLLEVIDTDKAPLFNARNVQASASLVDGRLRLGSLRLEHEQAVLTGSGNATLADNIPLSAMLNATLSDGQQIQAQVDGNLDRMTLKLVSENIGLRADGTLDLAANVPHVTADASLEQPYELTISERALRIEHAQLSLNGAFDALQATLTARVDDTFTGPVDIDLKARFDGEYLTIHDTTLDDGLGSVSVAAEVPVRIIDEDARANVDITLTQFCPLVLRERGDCQLNGALKGSVLRDSAGISATLTATVQGLVNGYPGTLELDAALDPARELSVQRLLLSNAENRLEASGHWGEELKLSGKLTLTELARSVPLLAGSGAGEFAVTGTIEQPALRAQLALQNAGVDGVHADAAELDIDWRGAERSDNTIRIAMQGIHREDLVIASADLSLRGSAGDHQLRFAARAADAGGRIECKAEMQQSLWHAHCAPPTVTTDEQRWSLDRPLDLSVETSTGAIASSGFCIKGAEVSICSESGFAFTDAGVIMDLVIRELPVGWLNPELAAELDIRGSLNLDAHISPNPDGQHTINASIYSSRIEGTTVTAGEEVPVALEDIRGDLRLDSNSGDLTLQMVTATGGNLALRVALDELDGARLISGQLELLNINLAPLAMASDQVLDASGTLGGLITIGGSLDSPELEGRLLLRDGLLTHEYVKRSLRDVLLELSFEGDRALLDGHFVVDKEPGTIVGFVDWRGEAWHSELTLRSERMVLTPLEDSEAVAVPEIKLLLNAQRMRIHGEVHIPEASIVVNELPKSAVSASPDTVIVGETRDDSQFDYELDLMLTLGNKVVFRGFGARAELGGSLRLSREAGYPMQANGRVIIESGRYTAWGQNLQVQEGRLVFNGNPARPDLRIVATRDIPDDNVEVGVRVTGDARDPTLEVFSRPTMDDNRALYYLLTGEAPGSETNLDFAVASVLLQSGVAGASHAAGNLLGNFGVEDFRVDAREVEGGTEVQLSGYITPDLFLRYGVSTFDKVHTLRLRYRLRQRLFLEAVSGVEDAIDLLYSFEH